MARVSFLSGSIFVAAGVVAAIAVLPMSGWSFRNQVSMLGLGAGKSRGTSFGERRVPTLTGENWDVSKREESLAMVFLVFGGWSPRENSEIPFLERTWFASLRQHEKRFPNDVEGFAAHARLLTQSPMINPATEFLPEERRSESDRVQTTQQRTAYANELLNVSTIGKKLEPENLYFAYCRMMALNVLGRFDDAREEAYRSARLRRFEDYAISEGEVLIRAVERNDGYRGEAFRTAVLAGIVLPHFASMKGTVTEMLSRCPQSEKLKLKWAIYRMQYTLVRESSTYIGILVGRSGMLLTLAKQGEFRRTERDEAKREAERKRFYSARASEFRSDLNRAGLLEPGDDPVKMLDDAERLSEVGKSTINTEYDPMFDSLFQWSAFASKLLMGFAGLLLAIPGLLIWSKRSPDSFNRTRGTLSIAFAGIFASLLTNVEQDSIAGHVPIILTVPVLAIAIMQAFDKNQKLVAIAFPIAIFLVAASAGILNGVYAAGFVSAFVGLAWLASRWSWLATALALLVTAACLFSLREPEFAQRGALMVIPLAFVAGSLLLSSPARWLGNVAACIVLVLTVLYGYSVTRDVNINAQLKSFNPLFVSEASRIREKAGLPKFSREPKLDFL